MQTEFKNENISFLVLDLYKEILNVPGKEISGLSINLNGFDNRGGVKEDTQIHKKIDLALKKFNMQSINTVANTIFPVNLWNPEYEKEVLYKRYKGIIKRIRKCNENKFGVYFERMINFKNGPIPLNQIDNVIKFYKSGNHRRSAFQVAIWDPERDMVNTRMRGFPCLQHLVFSCVKKKLIVIAFYATQFLFQRAYGNFLGLCNLGKFMSHELDIPLKAVKCYIGVEQLSQPITKADLKEVVNSI